MSLQIGVTALDLLGLDYTLLQGAAAEGTKPLPGLSTGGPRLMHSNGAVFTSCFHSCMHVCPMSLTCAQWPE